MKLTVKFILTFSLATLITACAPRGESKSVDEVLSIQKNKFSESLNSSKLDQAVSSQLGELKTKLEVIATSTKEESVLATSGEVTNILTGLINHAGYTSRPAMSEIATQYRVVSTSAADKLIFSKTKLLVARTFSVLNSELETTAFTLK